MKTIFFAFVVSITCLSWRMLEEKAGFCSKKHKCVFGRPVKGAICSHPYNLPASAVAPQFYSYNKGLLDSLEHFMNANRIVVLGIKVHSHILGAEQANMKLTMTIKDILYDHFKRYTSIDSARFKVVSMGELQPVLSEEKVNKSKSRTKTDFENNMRFEFEVLGYKLD